MADGIPVKYRLIVLIVALAIIAAMTAFPNFGSTFEVSVLS
jgi:Flp pilus assembly pilin Flp